MTENFNQPQRSYPLLQHLSENVDGVSYDEIENYVVSNSLKCSNYVAFYHQLSKSDPSFKNFVMQDSKCLNFVTSYDKWCLMCRNVDANKRCSKCLSVYFCSDKCAKISWPIHKLHCGRNIFNNCITCGASDVPFEKCPRCPVKFCSITCKNEIINDHDEIDCEKLFNIFGNEYKS